MKPTDPSDLIAHNTAEHYRPSHYRTPDGAPADIVIFTIGSLERSGNGKKSLPERELQVMLIRRKSWPFEGRWALPGGFCKQTEAMHDCARRELLEETGVAGVTVEHFGVYSAPGRDPRGWMLSHAYYALVNETALAERQAATDAADVQLFTVNEALEMGLAFDHTDMVRDALECIREKMLSTAIARDFLPEEFTLSELYQVIRAVVPEFEEPNFIRKITSTQSRKGLLEEVRDAAGRPKRSNRYSQRAAQLYRFTGFSPKLSIYS